MNHRRRANDLCLHEITTFGADGPEGFFTFFCDPSSYNAPGHINHSKKQTHYMQKSLLPAVHDARHIRLERGYTTQLYVSHGLHFFQNVNYMKQYSPELFFLIIRYNNFKSSTKRFEILPVLSAIQMLPEGRHLWDEASPRRDHASNPCLSAFSISNHSRTCKSYWIAGFLFFRGSNHSSNHILNVWNWWVSQRPKKTYQIFYKILIVKRLPGKHRDLAVSESIH